MSGQIPDKIKRERRDRAMAAQREVAARISQSFVGRTIKVLVEGRASDKQLQQARLLSPEHGLLCDGKIRNPKSEIRNYLVARGEADAPDIDGRVYVHGEPRGRGAALPIGGFARVMVTGHTDYDLIAKPAK